MSLVRPMLRFVLPITVIAALSFAVVARSSASPAPRNEEIEKAMNEMKGALEVLGKGIKADNKDAALEQLAKFEMAVIAAKAQTPDSAAKIDEKKRAEFVADFRKQLLQALELACQAETAVLDGKFKDADGLVRNKLAGLKSAGHSKFNPQEGGGK